jgi:hypothetical protein
MARAAYYTGALTFQINTRCTPDEALGKSIRHMLGQWPKLLPFLDDPHILLDTSRVKNGKRVDVTC